MCFPYLYIATNVGIFSERKKGRRDNKKKKAIYPRQPIFINLKSNTMKNTVQRYVVYVI